MHCSPTASFYLGVLTATLATMTTLPYPLAVDEVEEV